MGCTQLTLARRTCPSRESVIALTPLYYPCHIRTRVLRSPWNYSPSRAQPTNQPASSNPAPARTQAAEQFLDLPPRGISRSLANLNTMREPERESENWCWAKIFKCIFFSFRRQLYGFWAVELHQTLLLKSVTPACRFQGNTPKSYRRREELLKFRIKKNVSLNIRVFFFQLATVMVQN